MLTTSMRVLIIIIILNIAHVVLFDVATTRHDALECLLVVRILMVELLDCFCNIIKDPDASGVIDVRFPMILITRGIEAYAMVRVA